MKTKRQIRHDFMLETILKVRLETEERNRKVNKRKIKILFITLTF